MLRCDIFQLFLLERWATENFIANKRIEYLKELHESYTSVSCKILEWTGQGDVLLHDALKVKRRLHNFILAASLYSLIATACRNKVITCLCHNGCSNSIYIATHFGFFVILVVAIEWVNSVSQILVLCCHFGLYPGLFVYYGGKLELLLCMEVTQILSLLILEDAHEIACIHLKVCTQSFGHERHKSLEVAELTHCLDDLGVLHTFQILFKLARECFT